MVVESLKDYMITIRTDKTINTAVKRKVNRKTNFSRPLFVNEDPPHTLPNPVPLFWRRMKNIRISETIIWRRRSMLFIIGNYIKLKTKCPICYRFIYYLMSQYMNEAISERRKENPTYAKIPSKWSDGTSIHFDENPAKSNWRILKSWTISEVI